MSEHLWKQCARWLCDLEVLPSDHRIVQHDTKIEDLAYTLRDGVVLCHILATIDPKCINLKDVNQRPQMARFLCLKNIRIFLSICTSHFNLKESDLFETSMLYDYTDFERVLTTLSRFSKCSKVKELSKTTGFPLRNKIHKEPSEEQIYQKLEDLVNDDTYEEFYYTHHGGGTSNYAYTSSFNERSPIRNGANERRRSGRKSSMFYSPGREEDIYSELCQLRRSKRLLSSREGDASATGDSSNASHYVSGEPIASRLSVLQSEWNFEPKDKYDHCLKELLETEANYVDVLTMLRRNFIRKISKMKDLDKKTIFMNVRELGEIHGVFFTGLSECVTKKSHKRVGEIFLEFKEKFLKYGEYCSNLPKSQELLGTLYDTDEEVRKEIEECEESANEGRFRLRDLLSVPMQRILKYHLLLATLSGSEANTDSSLAQAYEAMLDVSSYINEVKRDSEHLQVISAIQTSITDWDMPAGIELKDYGRMRKDGELKVANHDTAATPRLLYKTPEKLRYVFIFDKMLLMCKPAKGDHYSYKDSFKFSDYKIQDLGSPTAIGTLAGATILSATVSSSRTLLRRETGKWTYSFMLVHSQQLNAFTLYARTKEEKMKWISAINDALNNASPIQRINSTHDPVMHTFEKPKHCASCHKLLKGLFYQGYQCTKCHAGVHRDCILGLPTCGMHHPPQLPPRPQDFNRISIPLPMGSLPNKGFVTREDTEDSVTCIRPTTPRQGSETSLMSTNGNSMDNSTLPQMPPPPVETTRNRNGGREIMNGNNEDYVNTRIEDHSWYVGEKDREGANQMLSRYPTCTFLVRRRVENGIPLGYALSLKSDTDVKHMKIMNSSELSTNEAAAANNQVEYFLSDTRRFKSIVELVHWFCRHSLRESFNGLDTTLRFPIGELSIVEAQYEFYSEEKNMLPLKAGDRVTIIDKSGDAQGWWKACDGRKIGYIPKEFVTHIS